MPEFVSFQKIPRLRRKWVATEKIDGSNASVLIVDGEDYDTLDEIQDPDIIKWVDGKALYAGSRNRWITPEKDNYGFAAWVRDNADELVKLGVGRHFGEWWGQGIQRNYGMTEKVWSLFNTKKWHLNPDLPACCRVVPLLVTEDDDFTDPEAAAEEGLYLLEKHGSYAAPGWKKPEGVVLYQPASGHLHKVTVEKDNGPKGVAA